MLADVLDDDPGAPVCFPQTVGGQVMTGYCSCRASQKTKSCPHFSQLIELVQKIKKENSGRSPGELLTETQWF